MFAAKWLAIGALSSACVTSAAVRGPLDCPDDSDRVVDSTVEGERTWWLCRDRHGKPRGPSLMTYGNGRVRNVGEYLDGEMDGPWRYFDREGHVEAAGTYRRGKRVGQWTWRDANGSRVEHYRDDGEQHGRFTRLFPNGALAEQGDYEAGKKVGLWGEWHRTGHLAAEATYVGGELHGLHRSYHPSGALASIETYAAGELQGDAFTFHENGTRKSVGAYRNGHATGRWVHFHSDGSVSAEGAMIDGKRHGDWRVDGRAIVYERGRQGPLRPCPAGTRERDECVARCCDLRSRWCERADGTRVGPVDVWDVEGNLVRSGWTDPKQ